MQSSAIPGKYHCCSGHCGQTSDSNELWCLERKYHKMQILQIAKRTDIRLYGSLWSGKAIRDELVTCFLSLPPPDVYFNHESRRAGVWQKKKKRWREFSFCDSGESANLTYCKCSRVFFAVAPWLVVFWFFYATLAFWLVDDLKNKKMAGWMWLTMRPPEVTTETFDLHLPGEKLSSDLWPQKNGFFS